MRLLCALAIASFCAPLAARAEEAAPAADTPHVEADAKTAALDFDLLGDSMPAPDPAAQAAQLAEAERVERLGRTRRTMLTLHQGLGLATLASMAGTTVVGQLAFDDKYRGGGATDRWLPLHIGLITSTTVLFTSVGLLGVLAPVPYEKRLRLDTATLHKAFMVLATVGMVTQLILGVVTRNSDGVLHQVDLATAHQVIGYTTLGAITAGAVTLTF